MKNIFESLMGEQPKGMDLFMSLDSSDNYIRTSKYEARLKTDYEKSLESEVKRLNSKIKDFNKLTFWQRLFYKGG